MKPTTLRALPVGFAFLVSNVFAQLTPGTGTGLTADANTVALFHFEDPAATALDSAGSNRNATVTNTTAGAGLFGSGRVFNGTGDRLEFGNVFNALSGSAGWTIEYFAQSADGVSAPYMQNGNSSAGWWYYPQGSNISYGIKLNTAGDSNWSVITSVASPAMDTAWHYYAMTWAQGGAVSIYRDGTFLGSSSTSGSWIGTNAYGVWLNYDSYWTTYGGAGVVDDIRFSNVARSAGEIQAAYTLATIPEPATYAILAGFGALGLALWRRSTAHL